MSACSFVVRPADPRDHRQLGRGGPGPARLLQGFATGGEYGTSATYMSEAATPHRRGFLSSFQYVTLVGGHVLAQFTPAHRARRAACRRCDRLGLADRLLHRRRRRAGGAVAAPVHGRVAQRVTPRGDPGRVGTRGRLAEDVVHQHWRPLLLVFLITRGRHGRFHTYTINAPAIVKSTFGSDRALTGTWINLLGLILLMVIQPIGGLLSDRLGRKPLLVFFGIGGVLYTYVLLTYLPHTTSPLGVSR